MESAGGILQAISRQGKNHTAVYQDTKKHLAMACHNLTRTPLKQ